MDAKETDPKTEERLLADFFENAAVGLHWVGPDGTIIRANRAELELLGYAKEEYIGRNIAEFHADPPVIEDILQKLSCGDTLHNYEARLRCKNGSIRNVLISSNVLWEDGKFVHTRCFTRDITELKRIRKRRSMRRRGSRRSCRARTTASSARRSRASSRAGTRARSASSVTALKR